MAIWNLGHEIAILESREVNHMQGEFRDISLKCKS